MELAQYSQLGSFAGRDPVHGLLLGILDSCSSGKYIVTVFT
jgi:hypothetical protein